MLRTLRISTLTLLIIVSVLGHTQSNTIEDYMRSIRINSRLTIPSTVNETSSATSVLTKLKEYYKDSIPTIRREAYRLTAYIGIKNKDKKIRLEVVNNLIFACSDKNSGVSGLASNVLKNFKKSDFNDIAKNNLTELINPKSFHLDKILLLVGYLNIKTALPIIKQQISSLILKSNQDKWAAYLALSRMGDSYSTEFCLNKVKNKGVNSDVIYELFPDLIYTRSKIIYDYIIEILMQENKLCESANPESTEIIPCGYRIIEMLAPVINNYPFEIDASGDIITSDYDLALNKVQEWFKTKKGKYEINKMDF